MGKFNFTGKFKRDAVAQIVERGHSTAEVSQRIGVKQGLHQTPCRCIISLRHFYRGRALPYRIFIFETLLVMGRNHWFILPMACRDVKRHVLLLLA